MSLIIVGRAAHDRHAGRVGVDQEHAQAAAAAFRAVGGGDELQKVGALGLGDPALVAVDDVVVALAHRGGAHGAGIGAGVGLRLRERGGLLAAQHREQIFLLLRRVEREQDRLDVGAEHAGPARRQRDRAGELLPHHDQAEQAEPLPAVFGRHVEQPQPELLGLALEVGAHVGAQVGAVHRGHLDRDQLAIDEGLDRVLEQLELLGKVEVHEMIPSSDSRVPDERASASEDPGPSAKIDARSASQYLMALREFLRWVPGLVPLASLAALARDTRPFSPLAPRHGGQRRALGARAQRVHQGARRGQRLEPHHGGDDVLDLRVGEPAAA